MGKCRTLSLILFSESCKTCGCVRSEESFHGRFKNYCSLKCARSFRFKQQSQSSIPPSLQVDMYTVVLRCTCISYWCFEISCVCWHLWQPSLLVFWCPVLLDMMNTEILVTYPTTRQPGFFPNSLQMVFIVKLISDTLKPMTHKLTRLEFCSDTCLGTGPWMIQFNGIWMCSTVTLWGKRQ